MNGLAYKAIELMENNPVYGYVYGAQGQIITQELLDKLKSWYGEYHPNGPTYYDEARTKRWLGFPATDCSGLVCSILDNLDIIKTDMTANTLMDNCTYLEEKDLVPGDLMFVTKNGHAEHVGIYIGNGETIQARGTDYGLVKTSKSEYSRWNAFGRLDFEIPDIEEKEISILDDELKAKVEKAIDRLAVMKITYSPDYRKAHMEDNIKSWEVDLMLDRIVNTFSDMFDELDKRQL